MLPRASQQTLTATPTPRHWEAAPGLGLFPVLAAPLLGRGLKMAEAAALPKLLTPAPPAVQHRAALTVQPVSRTPTPRSCRLATRLVPPAPAAAASRAPTAACRHLPSPTSDRAAHAPDVSTLGGARGGPSAHRSTAAGRLRPVRKRAKQGARSFREPPSVPRPAPALPEAWRPPRLFPSQVEAGRGARVRSERRPRGGLEGPGRGAGGASLWRVAPGVPLAFCWGGGKGRMTKIQPINPLWRGSCAPGPALTMLRARAPLPPCLLASAPSKPEVLAAGQMTASKAHRLARLPYRMALFLYCFTLIAYTFTKQPGATTESQLAQLPWTAASCPS